MGWTLFLELPADGKFTRNPPVSTAVQAGRARLAAGFRDQLFASAASASACSSTSNALGSKSSPIHSLSSAWRSCLGSLIAARNSAYPEGPPTSSGGVRRPRSRRGRTGIPLSGSLWTELNTIARALGVGPPCRSKPYAFDVDHEFDLAFSELGHVNLELELQVGIIGA